MAESKFKLYSIGIVAQPKALGSRKIRVLPVETTPFFDGEVKYDPTTLKDSGVDKDGKAYTVEVVTDNTILAEWIGGSDNQSSAPDVRRGERVEIYRYEQNDTFYWKSMGLDRDLRRLETVVHRWSGHTDERSTTLTDDNSYWLEISTHKGAITLHTSKKNGEATAYGIQVDAMNGTFTVKDDIGNHIFLDSVNHLIELENADHSILQLDRKKALLSTIDSIELKSKKITVNGSDSVTVNTKDHVVNATTSTFKLTNFIMNAAKATIKAVVAITGATSIKGAVVTTGTLTNNSKDVGATHIHAKTKPGSLTEVSGPVAPFP